MKLALEHGPIVCCVEHSANDIRILNSILNDDIKTASEYQLEKLNGIVALTIDAKSYEIDNEGNIIEENKHLTVTLLLCMHQPK